MEDLVAFVQQVCPTRTWEQITEVLSMISEQNPSDQPDQLVDTAVGMLLDQNGECSGPSQSINPNEMWEDEMEGAWGFERNDNCNELLNIFPDAREDFVWDYCQRQGNNFNLVQAIETFTNAGYERKLVDANSIWTSLKDALPLADPAYLKKQAEKLANEDDTCLQQFVNECLENNDLPSMQDFLKREREAKELSQYTTEFKFEHFLKTFPDPERHFGNPDRENPLGSSDVPQEDINYALTFLYDKYRKTRKRHIQLVFKMMHRRLWDCCQYLDKFPGGLKIDRPEEPACDTQNLELAQEVAYLKHRRFLRAQIKYRDQSYAELKEQAQASNLLVTCGVCFTEELIPEECFCCRKGCMFCKDCVLQHVQVQLGNGQTSFPCCNNCDSVFDLHTLQLVLSHDRETFEKLVLKIQSDEVRRANVDGLESCLFCDFSDVPPPESKIFTCHNPDCLKESCRLCGHEAHVPLRCDEVEYDENVRGRTHIEDMMTQGLVRTCHNCLKKFVKSDGCNKITCLCGAKMCYLCNEPIKGYEHFGDPPRCQLFTNDRQIDLARVRAQAEKARSELGDVEIKIDPTANLEDHYLS